jgi:hypothetical protein
MAKVARHPLRKEQLAPRALFYSRVVRGAALSLGMVSFTLAVGTIGYIEIAGLAPIDAFHLASMLMSGMGPVGDVDKFSDAAKLFDSFYALFCGVVLLASVGLVFAPIVHRLLHRFHIEDTSDPSARSSSATTRSSAAAAIRRSHTTIRPRTPRSRRCATPRARSAITGCPAARFTRRSSRAQCAPAQSCMRASRASYSARTIRRPAHAAASSMRSGK